MVRKNCDRAGCVDVFRSYLVADAVFAGDLEMPVLQPTFQVPRRMPPFSQAIAKRDRKLWVHFFEDDSKFERIWNNPKRYLDILGGFEGIIAPDFSIYRDMPLVMQYWNIYRSRAIAHALQSRGCDVIPNLRFGDRRTWDTCTLGIPSDSTVAVGSHGSLRDRDDRRYFKEGLDYVIGKVRPRTVVVYGAAPDSIFGSIRNKGIEVVSFESVFSGTRKKGF